MLSNSIALEAGLSTEGSPYNFSLFNSYNSSNENLSSNTNYSNSALSSVYLENLSRPKSSICYPIGFPYDPNQRLGLLILKDGTVYAGYSFGSPVNASGECAFQTGMVGYPESLTDVSYTGQILIPTYPLIGGYGVPNPEKMITYKTLSGADYKMSKYLESNTVKVTGLIVSHYNPDYSHYLGHMSLSEWLVQDNVPALYGIDTRALTKKIREGGAILGKIIILPSGTDLSQIDIPAYSGLVPWYDPNTVNVAAEISTKEPVCISFPDFDEEKDPSIIAVDVGMKLNQIRCFLKRRARIFLVPWDFDINIEVMPGWNAKIHGLFISNGPGDPKQCTTTIANLSRAFKNCKVPIFGICLGHQICCLAAGGQTKKMPFGHRGHNIPCRNLKDGRCYITSQNHGFAVEFDSLPKDEWDNLFINVNDNTNEGIIHKSKPIFSVQFHPEAAPGPQDVEYLFDLFLDAANSNRFSSEELKPIYIPQLPIEYPIKFESIKKVLILGSGAFSINQACEFDYSGSQTIKALKEENIYIVLMNSNIANTQVSKDLVDRVYFLPIEPHFVRQVIKYERPDGIYITFGGQSALEVGIQMKDEFQSLGVQILGTPVESIICTESTELFSKKMDQINEKSIKSFLALDFQEAKELASELSYPVVLKAKDSMEKLHSYHVSSDEELDRAFAKTSSLSSKTLIEKSLKGWKSIEFELVRDAYDGCITVCSMEGFDSFGDYAPGDGIVVTPIQTLSNENFQTLRTTAIKVIRHLQIIGECNIKFALCPISNDYYIISMNTRLSHSSALASKSTGYPLAFVAAKLGLGIKLDEIRNKITTITFACFEPSLDYVAVKIPCWNFENFFERESKTSESSNPECLIKSIGEVIAVGRNFEEAIQKAVRALEIGYPGFSRPSKVNIENPFEKSPGSSKPSLDERLKTPSQERLFYIADAFHEGYSVQKISEITHINEWFLQRLFNIYKFSTYLEKLTFNQLYYFDLYCAKQMGFSDLQIANIIHSSELAIYQLRKEYKLFPFVKQIDTVAAEFTCSTNYLYLTYSSIEHDTSFDEKGIIVFGSGVYHTGNSIEFDYYAINCIRTLKENGYKTIMINNNPETASTNFDEADRLYLENMSLETILDIYNIEGSAGIINSLGGQISNTLALQLYRLNVKILGTSPENIDKAENRYKFSRFLDKIGVDQPWWKELTDTEDARSFCQRVSYPVLLRFPNIKNGALTNIIYTEEDLMSYLNQCKCISKDFPLVVSKYILDAKELEVGGVALQGKVIIHAICEHIENADIHSGDSTLLLPPQESENSDFSHKLEAATKKIAQLLCINGPFNFQFLIINKEIKLVECNLRVSKSFPFVSTVLDVDFFRIATLAIIGHPSLKTYLSSKASKLNYINNTSSVAIKVPQFSSIRLDEGGEVPTRTDQIYTGESVCFGKNKNEAFIKALLATGFTIPKKNIFISIDNQKDKEDFLPHIVKLQQLGYDIFSKASTAEFFINYGIPIKILDRISSSIMEEEVDPNTTTSTTTNAKGIESESAKNTSGTLAPPQSELQTLQNYNSIELYIKLSCKNKFQRSISYFSLGNSQKGLMYFNSIPLIANSNFAKLLIETLSKGYSSVEEIGISPEIDCKSSSEVLKLRGIIDITPFDTVYDNPETLFLLCKMGVTLKNIMYSTSFKKFNFNAPLDYFSCYNLIDGKLSLVSDELLMHDSLKYINLDSFVDNPSIVPGIINKILKLSSGNFPILIQARGYFLTTVLLFSTIFNKPIHILHVTTKEDLEMINLTRSKGGLVTCSVAIFNLFIYMPGSNENRLIGNKNDVDYLIQNISSIDCFCFGKIQNALKGIDVNARAISSYYSYVALPLLINLVKDGILSFSELKTKIYHFPKKFLSFSEQEDTGLEIETDRFIFPSSFSRFSSAVASDDKSSSCSYHPYNFVFFQSYESLKALFHISSPLKGTLMRVLIRGQTTVMNNEICRSNEEFSSVLIPPSGISYCNIGSTQIPSNISTTSVNYISSSNGIGAANGSGNGLLALPPINILPGVNNNLSRESLYEKFSPQSRTNFKGSIPSFSLEDKDVIYNSPLPLQSLSIMEQSLLGTNHGQNYNNNPGNNNNYPYHHPHSFNKNTFDSQTNNKFETEPQRNKGFAGQEEASQSQAQTGNSLTQWEELLKTEIGLSGLKLRSCADFYKVNIISVSQYRRPELNYIFNIAEQMRSLLSTNKRAPGSDGSLNLLQGKILCNLFFEPSIRTSCSFEAAMIKLGGSVIKVQNDTSFALTVNNSGGLKTGVFSKEESFEDKVKTVGTYVDAIVIRHPVAASISQISTVPIINAGDGSGEHPSQGLMDIFTIREEFGTVNGLTITLVGDLLNGRSAHSLVKLLLLYEVKIIYVCPPGFELPAELLRTIDQHPNITQMQVSSILEALPLTDVLYMTRIQREKVEVSVNLQKKFDMDRYKINNKLLREYGRKNMIIMHPLPRGEEIDPEIDFDNRAAYFRQMKYGLYIRMALLYLLLKRESVLQV